MPSLADTIRQLQAFRSGGMDSAASAVAARLRPLTAFGANPGELDGWFYAPDNAAGAPLVVVLHGCTQTASGYDRCSGWSELAERHGFALLFPEQRRANNPTLCFNWFSRQHTTRGGGEALSIRQMVATLSDRHAVDPGRVFVTGLSAGGAMASVMLATYPEVFAGGAIIAGLPYGAATSMPEALARMRGQGHEGEDGYVAKVMRASPHRGPWPTISVWHGDADRTVDVGNAELILSQWRSLHGLAVAPDRVEVVDSQQHRVWLGRDGRVAVEDYRIAGLGHGAPLKTSGPGSCGAVGPYMLEAGISSTVRQAERWGLLDGGVALADQTPTRASARSVRAAGVTGHDTGLTDTIQAALRSAGLMR